MRQTVRSRSSPRAALILAVAASLAASVATVGNAGAVSLHADAYVVQENGRSFSVIDLYADLPSASHQVWSVAGNVSLLGGSTWFHDDASGGCPDGGTWLPVGSDMHPLADSFVTVGLPLLGRPNATGLAPTFIDDPACSSFLGDHAGWFNSYPPGFQGYATDVTLHDGSLLLSATMLGRFTIAGLPATGATLKLEGFTVGYSFASGPTDIFVLDEATFAYVPAPPALFLVAGCVVCGGRRRRAGADTR